MVEGVEVPEEEEAVQKEGGEDEEEEIWEDQEDMEETEDMEEAENMEEAEDTEEAEDMEEAEDTEEAEDISVEVKARVSITYLGVLKTPNFSMFEVMILHTRYILTIFLLFSSSLGWGGKEYFNEWCPKGGKEFKGWKGGKGWKRV